MKTGIKFLTKERITGLVALIFETAILLLCYFISLSHFSDTAYMTVAFAATINGLLIILSFIASFFLVFYIKFIAIERKILIIAGFLAICLALMGMTEIVMENQISFWDALYKSFQLFVGEFGDLSYTPGTFPIMLELARFLALFVTFGTIIVIALGKQLRKLNIRLFYRDILIITDKSEGYIMELASDFKDIGMHVIIGCTSDLSEYTLGEIPVLKIDVDVDIKRELKKCNAAVMHSVYVLCEDTGINVKIGRGIRDLISIKKLRKQKNKTSAIKSYSNKTDSDDSFEYYINTLNTEPSLAIEKLNKKNECVCYVMYKNETDREFYSYDDLFVSPSPGLRKHFVKITDVCIRQLLAEHCLSPTIDFKHSADDCISQLEKVNFAVVGPSEKVKSSILEICKLCVYSLEHPISITHLSNNMSYLDNAFISRIKDLVTIAEVSLLETPNKNISIDYLIVTSDDIKDTRKVIHTIFKTGFYKVIKYVIILTDTTNNEFNVLDNFINSISNSDSNPQFIIGRTKHLIKSIDSFYRKHAPDSEDVHRTYKKVIEKGLSHEFSMLPEIYIDSGLLSSLHNSYIDSIMLQTQNLNLNEKQKLFSYLAATEHDRWFNERIIQGFVYADEMNRSHRKSQNLVRWIQLDKSKRESNYNYVLSSMISIRKNKEAQQ